VGPVYRMGGPVTPRRCREHHSTGIAHPDRVVVRKFIERAFRSPR
jgi:hypothetical protein